MTARAGPAYGEGAEAILAATVRVVGREGLRGLTFRSVAAEARVNNSLIAYHFGTRDRLIMDTLWWAIDRSIAQSGLAGDATSAAEYVARLLTAIDAEPELQAFQYEMILESRRRRDLVPAVQELYRFYVEALSDKSADFGIPPLDETSARRAFAALDGLVLQYLGGAVTREQFEGLALAVLMD